MRPAAHPSNTPAAAAPPADFVSHLERLAATRAHDLALVALGDREDGQADLRLSYGELAHRVRALAAVLQQRFTVGDRALILLENSEHYVVAFLACLYAGLVAVPAFPPETTRPHHLARLRGMVADAQPSCLLTLQAVADQFSAVLQALTDVTVVAMESVPGTPGDVLEERWGPRLAGQWRPHRPAANDIAFLQYTSGSTSSPKGVMVSHASLMANERAIEEGLGVGPQDVFVTWLPLFHDMGLIGGMLQPLHRGIPLVLMSTRLMLERPLRWLQAISRYRGTISGGPDFAYRLCVDRVRETSLSTLDLSSWRVAFSGAEPVRHDTLVAFKERFAATGLTADALYPCYGLAEATLFVTGGVRGGGLMAHRFDATALALGRAQRVDPSDTGTGTGTDDSSPDGSTERGALLVACGRAPRHHEVRIVHPGTGHPEEAGRIGEIWASGPSLASGYWQRPEASDETFVMRDGQRWLRTGDLGFVHDGELYVAGRLKDMIILRGHNVYPQDLERAIEADVEAVRKGRVAAFPVTVNGEEGIGIAAEVSRGLQKLVTPQALADLLGEVVSGVAGQAPSALVLLNPGGLPKTSSGKLQRAACRSGWMDRSLDAYAWMELGPKSGSSTGALAAVQSLSPTAEALAALWRDVLQLSDTRTLGPDAHFLTLGGHSLLAVQLAQRIREQWGVDIPTAQLFDAMRLQAQADALDAAIAAGSSSGSSGRPAASHPGSHPSAAVTSTRLAPIPADLRRGPLPLTASQQQQYFLWRVDPTSSAYHIPCVLQINGEVDPQRLRAAFAALVARHEALRTVFRPGLDGNVEQWVMSDGEGMPDLAMHAAPTRQDALLRIRDLLQVPFDLAKGPLVRACLVRVNDGQHVLALIVHHIVADGTSLQVLLGEWATLYAGLPLPPVALQWGDYAAWCHERHDPQRDHTLLDFWRHQARGKAGEPVAPLVLTPDQPRQAGPLSRTASLTMDLPAPLVAALRDRAGQHNSSLFMVLLAGFKIVLHRYTADPDIRIGVPFANRATAQLQSVIGCFVNTVVLRTPVAPSATLSEVLQAVRSTVLAAQDHQDFPLDRLTREGSSGAGGAPRTPFQIVFNHLNVALDPLQRPTGWTVTDLPLPPTHAQFELTLETRERASGQVTSTWIWPERLFDRATMERLAGHLQQVLQALAEAPNTRVREVSLLLQAETRALLAWGAPAAGPASSASPARLPVAAPLRGPFLPVHARFAAQAHAQPDAPALIAGEQRLSYAELDRQANQLAHHLRSCGVGPDVAVGVALERSPRLVVCLLAVLKAGGAYVPLDTAHPADRLRLMIEDSGLRLLLTGSGELARWRTGLSIPVVEVDRLNLADLSSTPPEVDVHPENLAYVIYTSGSTGAPKGVAVAHGPFAMHCVVTATLYEMDPRSRELHFLSFSFDGAHERLFTALCCGASLVLRETALWSPKETLAVLDQQGATHAGFPAVYLQELAHTAAGQSKAPPLHLYSFGGEAMPREGLALARQHLAAQVFINGYGPTEAVVTPTLWKTTRAAPLPTGPYAPIGRPVGDRKALVLDPSLNLLPAGQVGELYLGGSGLARGYLGRPALTADRFIADPFDAHGGRLYRTGDLVRWNADGQLEYAGRADQQIKIRGFRIEPGEIEAALLSQPGVRQAAVVVSRGGLSAGGVSRSGAHLIGYVAAQPGQRLDGHRLRAQLADLLPDYMVPSVLEVLAALPVTVNGKVDRAALPAPEHRAGAGQAPGGLPVDPAADPELKADPSLTALEQSVAALWAEVLGIAAVGRTDNFFDLGGHSLLIIRLHRLLEDRLQAQLRLVDLFKYPNVASLARRLHQDAAPVTPPSENPTSSRREALLRRKRTTASSERTS
jgi:amino acid adenylation domain-containing protein